MAFDVVQISVRIPVAHALVVVFLIVWALNPYLGFRTTGSFTMFSGLVTEGPGTNHFFMPSVHLVEYQNELLAPIRSTNERLQQLADDGQLVTVFETRRLLEDDPGATLVAHLDGEIVRVEGDFDQLGDAPPPALTKIWFFRWIPGTGEPQCTN